MLFHYSIGFSLKMGFENMYLRCMKKDYKARKYMASTIRSIRAELRISQAKLAELADCNPNYIGKIENEQSEPSLSAIISIARALKISPRDLIPEK